MRQQLGKFDVSQAKTERKSRGGRRAMSCTARRSLSYTRQHRATRRVFRLVKRVFGHELKFSCAQLFLRPSVAAKTFRRTSAPAIHLQTSMYTDNCSSSITLLANAHFHDACLKYRFVSLLCCILLSHKSLKMPHKESLSYENKPDCEELANKWTRCLPGLDNPNDPDTIRILIATDSHVGYNERDAIRGDDSWKTFHEVMTLAKKHDVDMVLHGGDLFHENKPSRKSMYQVMRSLRMNCFGDRPCQLEMLSDASENFQG